MFATSLLATSLLLAAAQAPPGTPCPPAGMTRADLVKLKGAKFEIAAVEERNALAVRLLGCLDDPDPAIRDGVVFEGLSRWLRAKALTPATMRALDSSLRSALDGPGDAGGFKHPFAALVLSEVARTDRVEPWYSDEARASLVALAATSLARVDDYRGYDNTAGWRHGVAHGADLVLQLGLNPKVGGEGLGRLMEAVRGQIAPAGPVFYTFGEPERLARAVVFTYRRGVLDAAYWDAWFASLASPKPLSSWGSAFQSVEGLAKRHNTLTFLHALAFAGRAGGDEAGKALAEKADKAATEIMRG